MRTKRRIFRTGTRYAGVPPGRRAASGYRVSRAIKGHRHARIANLDLTRATLLFSDDRRASCITLLGPIRRPGGLRLEVGQTRSCIPRSDAPGRTSGSRRIHVPHDRRPTAPTSSTPSHAARRASRTRRAGCRIGLSAARHTATLAAWSPAVNRAMNRYQRSPKICEYATEYRDVSVPGSPPSDRPSSRTGTRRSGFGQGHAHGIPVLRDAPESQYTVRGPQLTQQCTVHTIHT